VNLPSSKELHFKKTTSHRGRLISVAPSNSCMEHLHYGRILLGADTPNVAFETQSRETGFICLAGECTVRVGSQDVALGLHDGMYIPRGSKVEVSTTSSVDIIEFSAEVTGAYPLQIVRYADIAKDPTLRLETGVPGARRILNNVLGKNVTAGRILGGFTHSQPGHWTSWPPHEHGEKLEEIYAFIDMPAPAFAIQFVYTNTETPEFIGVVREGDAVLMPAGYHPNVSIPGHSVGFVWMMAARREVEDRKFGVVNVQPEFATIASGLDAARPK